MRRVAAVVLPGFRVALVRARSPEISPRDPLAVVVSADRTERTMRHTVVLLVLTLTGAALAQSSPNFAGTWVLNTARSRNLGMMAA